MFNVKMALAYALISVVSLVMAYNLAVEEIGADWMIWACIANSGLTMFASGRYWQRQHDLSL